MSFEELVEEILTSHYTLDAVKLIKWYSASNPQEEIVTFFDKLIKALDP